MLPAYIWCIADALNKKEKFANVHATYISILKMLLRKEGYIYGCAAGSLLLLTMRPPLGGIDMDALWDAEFMGVLLDRMSDKLSLPFLLEVCPVALYGMHTFLARAAADVANVLTYFSTKPQELVKVKTIASVRASHWYMAAH